MKIVLVTGMSGTGKTSICKYLCTRYKGKFNFVCSYTDRQKREKNEWGHKFVDSQCMDLLLKNDNIVAQTQIEQYRYCTLSSQFDENKINLYTVDANGIDDTIKTFPYADIMIVLIRKRDIEADCVRINRDVDVPIRDNVDFIIDNDGKLESSGDLLNALVSFDLFNKPSHVALSLGDKLDYVDRQYRFLELIKESLYEQLWYANVNDYIDMCQYVESHVNDDFDFDISVLPDTGPEIVNGYLTFNVQARYENADLMWDEINRLVEKLSFYSHQYCDDNKLYDMMYRIAVSEYLVDDYD